MKLSRPKLLEHLRKRFQDGNATGTQICFDRELSTVTVPDLIEVVRLTLSDKTPTPKKKSSKRKKTKQ
jgi:hypothetical protein